MTAQPTTTTEPAAIEPKDPPSALTREAVQLWQSVLDIVNNLQHASEDQHERKMRERVLAWIARAQENTGNERRRRLLGMVADVLAEPGSEYPLG